MATHVGKRRVLAMESLAAHMASYNGYVAALSLIDEDGSRRYRFVKIMSITKRKITPVDLKACCNDNSAQQILF